MKPTQFDHLKAEYEANPSTFEFSCSMYIAGKHNAPVRQQIIKFCTGSEIPKSKAAFHYTVRVLINKFNQQELF